MFDIPLELFLFFVAISGALTACAFLFNPRILAFPLVAGMLIFTMVATTDNIIMGYNTEGSSDTLTHYNVQSSTGQVLINSVSSHSRGERLSNTASALTDDTFDCITVYLGRSGSPPATSLIQVGVMDTSTQFIRVFGSMNTTALVSSAVTPYAFCLPLGDSYTFTDTETVGIKWNSGDATNTLTSRVDANNPFDGNNSEHVNSTGASWSANAGQDIMMVLTLRGSSGTVEPILYEFTEMPKLLFGLYGSLIMVLFALAFVREK